MSHNARKPVFGVSDRSNTNRPVQSQEKVRTLKLGVEVEEELYYLISKNIAADQLRSYCEADLCLCFCIGQSLVFSWHSSYVSG